MLDATMLPGVAAIPVRMGRLAIYPPADGDPDGLQRLHHHRGFSQAQSLTGVLTSCASFIWISA
jgi:hypothetical protein